MGDIKRIDRIGEQNFNHQGCLMEIVEYRQYRDIIVEFQDENRAKVHTNYQCFLLGNVKNPYHPSIYGAGVIGNKYLVSVNCKAVKEYKTWSGVIQRCYDKKYQNEQSVYKDVTCCKEWLLYENFYEWLHNQSNFSKWCDGDLWAIDKDILVKGNKIYSPDTCCLVPLNVNTLFTKNNQCRGALPIGVSISGKYYRASCQNPLTNKCEKLGNYSTPEKAFQAYKNYKEDLIKQIAQIEYNNGNITEKCCDAMMKYQVEITD